MEDLLSSEICSDLNNTTNYSASTMTELYDTSLPIKLEILTDENKEDHKFGQNVLGEMTSVIKEYPSDSEEIFEEMTIEYDQITEQLPDIKTEETLDQQTSEAKDHEINLGPIKQGPTRYRYYNKTKPTCIRICTTCNKDSDKHDNNYYLIPDHAKLESHYDNGKPIHKCIICKETFSLKSYFYCHRMFAHGEKFYRCSFCKVLFSYKPLTSKPDKTKLVTSKRNVTSKTVTSKLVIPEPVTLKLVTSKPVKSKPMAPQTDTTSIPMTLNNVTLQGENGGNKAFKCSICEKTFTRQTNFKGHMNKHNGVTPYKCNICQKSYSLKSSLSKHLLSSHSKHGKKMHSRPKENKKTKPKCISICTNCNKGSDKPINDLIPDHLKLKSHYGRDRTIHKCCEKSFFQKSDFYCHRMLAHGEKFDKCNICKQGWMIHSCCKASKPLTSKPDITSKPGKTKLVISEPKTLKLVTSKPVKSKPVISKTDVTSKPVTSKTDVTSKPVTSKTDVASKPVTLNYVTLPDGEKALKCSICKKTIKGKTNFLKGHMNKHNGVMPHKCSICQKTFISRKGFRGHMNKHNGVSYKCSICQKGFYFKSNLTRHLSSHSAEKLHQCIICQEKYSLKSNLKKHMASCHSERETSRHSERETSCRSERETSCHSERETSCHFERETSCHSERETSCHSERETSCHSERETSCHSERETSCHSEEILHKCSIVSKGQPFSHDYYFYCHKTLAHEEKFDNCSNCKALFSSKPDVTSEPEISESDVTSKPENSEPRLTPKSVILRPEVTSESVISKPNIKPQTCYICGFTFEFKSDLDNHMLSKHVEKPHKCSICQEEFSYKFNLENHMYILHNTMSLGG